MVIGLVVADDPKIKTPKRENEINKQWESERSRIEHADDARITFTFALHGEHAGKCCWKRHRYHSVSHGWATEDPHDWEKAIAPVLRRLFVNSRLGLATKAPTYDASNGSSANTNVPMLIPPSVAPQRAQKPI